MARQSSTGKYSWKGTKSGETLDGSTLSDSIQGRGLIIDGAGGNDTLVGGSGADTLKGGIGNDTLIAQANDLIGTPSGTLIYDGGNGSDVLDLSGIVSAEGTGIFVHSSSSNSIIILDLEQTGTPITSEHEITWDASKEWKNSFTGIENIITGDGNDEINFDNVMGYGPNKVWSGAGDDFVTTGGGNDFIDAGAGDDFIVGGPGDDILTGGEGNDAFTFLGGFAGEYQRDVITDFDIFSDLGANQDQLRLRADYTLDWDPTAAVLTGIISSDSGLVGQVQLLGLTYSDAASVAIHYHAII